MNKESTLLKPYIQASLKPNTLKMLGLLNLFAFGILLLFTGLIYKNVEIHIAFYFLLPFLFLCLLLLSGLIIFRLYSVDFFEDGSIHKVRLKPLSLQNLHLDELVFFSVTEQENLQKTMDEPTVVIRLFFENSYVTITTQTHQNCIDVLIWLRKMVAAKEKRVVRPEDDGQESTSSSS